MKFKDYIKESIIDIPRRRYAPGVFDDADTNNPKLKKIVVDMILDQIDKFQETYPVKKYSLIGSILTKRYRDDADDNYNKLPAPTILPSPIRTPFIRIAPIPIRQSSPIVQPCKMQRCPTVTRVPISKGKPGST